MDDTRSVDYIEVYISEVSTDNKGEISTLLTSLTNLVSSSTWTIHSFDLKFTQIRFNNQELESTCKICRLF